MNKMRTKKGRRVAAVRARVKKAIVAAGLIAAAVFCSGFFQEPGVLVETTYTVQRGDCLREISEEYREKNTYGSRYILEFEEGIHELNPWIRERGIHPGDVIRINYWVKQDEVKAL